MIQLTTDAAIQRFGENEERVDIFVNDALNAGRYTTTGDEQVKTLPALMIELEQRYLTGVVRGAWAGATAYAQNDIVTQGGVTYIGIVPHTSGTFATDLAAGKWAVYQGVAKTELAESGGAAIIGFDAPGDMQSTTVQQAIEELFEGVYKLNKVFSNCLPLGLLYPPNAFNDRLKLARYFNGNEVVYLQDPYDAIDFTKKPDTAINVYYVNYQTGNDSNNGTSTGTAWKSLHKARQSAVEPAIIYLMDEWIGYLSIVNLSATWNGRFKIASGHPSGKTRICNMREEYSQATFNFNYEGSGCWSTSEASTSSTIFSYLGYASFDAKYPDENGGAMPLPQAASSAACIATPGTQFHDSVGKKKYIHLIDGRKPNPADGWIYSFPVGGWNVQQASTSAGVFLLENLHFYLNAGSADNAGVRYRHSTSAVNDSRYGVKGCLSYGASGNGFEIYDAQIVAISNSKARYNRRDNFNYHSFVSTGTKGAYMTVYEYCCNGAFAGYDGFANQPSLSASCNASSAHDSINIERTSCNHGGGNGATIADVNGCVSVNWFVKAGPATGGIPKSCFWQENYLKAGTYDGMWLWGCQAHNNGDSSVKLITNEAQADNQNGQVYVKYWQGQTNGAIVGSLKDFAGNLI